MIEAHMEITDTSFSVLFLQFEKWQSMTSWNPGVTFWMLLYKELTGAMLLLCVLLVTVGSVYK